MLWQEIALWVLLVFAAVIASVAMGVTLYQQWDRYEGDHGPLNEAWQRGYDFGYEDGQNSRTMAQNIEVGPRSHRGRCVLIDDDDETEDE